MELIASQHAPSRKVVVPHYGFAGIIWLVSVSLILIFPESMVQHYFNPTLLAIVHLIALGWISMVILGALYQLIPVIFEIKLFSEILAKISFYLLSAGSILLGVSFYLFELNFWIIIGGLSVNTAIIIFAWNIWKTIRKSAVKSIERTFIVTSIVWLILTVMAGLLLAFNLKNPIFSKSHLDLLKVHATAGMAGWFFQLVMGVGSKILPMFLVTHKLRFNLLKSSWWLFNTGLTFTLISITLDWSYGLLFSVLVLISAILTFLYFMKDVYVRRVKKRLEPSMKQSFYSFLTLFFPLAILATSSLFGVSFELNFPLTIAYGIGVLIGFFSSLIMGQTFKTLPFIIWLNIYRSRIGKGKIPLPKDLYSEKIVNTQMWTFLFALPLLLVGILLKEEMIIQLAALIMWISTILYNYNLWKIILHKPTF